MSSTPDLLPRHAPRRTGAYHAVRLIGNGGMASVYEAVHEKLQKRVAIKILHPHLASSATTVERFLREGRAAAQIEHPNVVSVFEVGEHDGVPYLVMELLEGIDLDAKLKQGPLAIEETARIMLPVIAAVRAAHAAGIVHRDLKPSNIFLARDRFGELRPKVLDFGISKIADEGALTNTESLLGTPSYMSPEQARRPKDADAKSDQYSIGAILYECATGALPHAGASSFEVLSSILTAEIRPPSSIRAEIPRELDALVLRALSKSPADRHRSLQELGAQLAKFAPSDVQQEWSKELAIAPLDPAPLPTLSEATVIESRAAPRRPAEPSWDRRWIALIAVALAAFGVIWLSRREMPPVGDTTKTVAVPLPIIREPEPTPAPQKVEPPPAPPMKGSPPRAKPRAPEPKSEPREPPIPIGDNGAPILR